MEQVIKITPRGNFLRLEDKGEYVYYKLIENFKIETAKLMSNEEVEEIRQKIAKIKKLGKIRQHIELLKDEDPFDFAYLIN